MPRCQAVGAKFLCHAQEIGEFRPHIAADAGHRGAPRKVIVSELFDHFFAERAFMIEHVMRDPEPVGHGARIADVVTGAAGTFAPGGRAIIIKLQRNADHFCAG